MNKMMNDEDAERLLNACKSGDDDATKAIFDRYVARLVILANNRLSQSMKRRLDGEDIVQSAYRTFFRRMNEDCYQLDDFDQLWRLLAAITLFKVRQKVEFHTAKKRSIWQEVCPQASLDVTPEAIVKGPSENEAAAATEILQQLLEGMTPVQQRVIRLRMDGEDLPGIARAVLRSERTVRRALKEVETLLKQRFEEAMRDEQE